MTSILKVDTIQDQAGNNIINESSDTITIGASGDTITIPSGATIDFPMVHRQDLVELTSSFLCLSFNNNMQLQQVLLQKYLDTVAFDTDSCYDNTTNYRFTPTTAGKYFCYGAVSLGTVSGISQL
jgi:hypothetical protein